MVNLNGRELAGGLFLTGLGAAFALYALANYSIGTVTRMGPGMVPLSLGVVLAVFGIVVTAGARWKPSDAEEIRVFVPAVILASIVAFAVLIKPFGLMPAVFASAAIATLAEGGVRPRLVLALGLTLCVMAWLIFAVALQLPLSLFAWPF